ncbi:hypothetical protein WA026_003483 [Henosepilachna vigintioctopunctata]|uniref:Uncharacterized protein n=1 Tax=Henosepilachna vigintioctopunctata TaxID=420089 RepID=A0AAW1TNY9_9CUCU
MKGLMEKSSVGEVSLMRLKVNKVQYLQSFMFCPCLEFNQFKTPMIRELFDTSLVKSRGLVFEVKEASM